MKYTFEKEPLTCVLLEKELGLKRGDIEKITNYSDGVVEIETKIDLSASNQEKVKAILAKQNLPTGKKPKV